MKNRKGVQIAFAVAAIRNMERPRNISAVSCDSSVDCGGYPNVAKAAALGAVGNAAEMALQKATRQGYKKRNEERV